LQATLFGKVPFIVIDVHETRGECGTANILIKILEKEEITYRIEHLPIGDYLLPNETVIERKTVIDLIHTLKGSQKGIPRLEKQLEAMAEKYSNPILVIEGGLAIRKDPINKCIYVPLKRTTKDHLHYIVVEKKVKFSPKAYEALKHEMEQKGIVVIETFDALHTALFICQKLKEILGEKEEKGPKKQIPIIRLKPKLSDISQQQIFFLAGLPGISTVRAQKILEVFKTPIKAIQNIDKWRQLKGIGPQTIKGIKKILYTEYSS